MQLGARVFLPNLVQNGNESDDLLRGITTRTIIGDQHWQAIQQSIIV